MKVALSCGVAALMLASPLLHAQTQSEGPIADSTQYLADSAKHRGRQVENNNHPGGERIDELPTGVSRLPEIWDEVGEKKAIPVKDADAIFVAEVTKVPLCFPRIAPPCFLFLE